MKKSINYIVGIVLFLLTILTLFVLAYQEKDIVIYGEKDSYAYEYAKKNNIEFKTIADSEKKYYSEKIENYKYNLYENKGIELEEYNGKSEELVIPAVIDNNIVLSLGDNLFENTNVKKVYLPYTIININPDTLKDIEVYCYDNDVCKSLDENKDLKVTVLSDSEYYPYFTNTEFEYNIGEKIEIIKYKGKDKDLYVPESIDGYEVNSLVLEINDDIENIYIPSSVEKIDFSFKNSPYDTLFFTIIGFDALALVLFIISNLLTSHKSLTEEFNNTPRTIINFLYLVFVYGYSILSYYNYYDLKQVIIVLAVGTLVYAVLAIALGQSKKKIESYDQKIAKADKYVKDTLELLNDLDLDNYSDEVKKVVDEVKELVKYSDSISSDLTKELEKEIQDKITASKDNKEDWMKIKKLIEKRNRIIKDNK